MGALYLELLDFSLYLDWGFLSLGYMDISWGLFFDKTSCVFLGVVSLISSGILRYCIYYMSDDESNGRFLFTLLVFVASMCALVISPNLVSIMLGWDGLGLSSYALVIYYGNESSSNAGMLTVLSNRIGDVFLLLAIGLMFSNGSWTFIFMDYLGVECVILVIMAAMTKSAQIPFSAWLPAAMAAPTPVSSLVHSSTLVTAGVYLLIRFSNLILVSGLSWLLFLVGCLTMVMAGWGANFEQDMKKVVAFSTLSQLGLMVMCLGMGYSSLAFFHLVVHALFKSSLFMCVGVMIHTVGSYQDSRVLSSFFPGSPILMFGVGITNLALSGAPFLAGFYSKDLVLESCICWGSGVMLFFSLLATGFTFMYSLRLIYKSSECMSMLGPSASLSEAGSSVVIGFALLLGLSCTGGFFYFWFFYYLGGPLVLFGISKFYVMFVLMLSGLLVLLIMSRMEDKSIIFSPLFNGFSSLMWWLPSLSTGSSLTVGFTGGRGHIFLFESGWMEFYGARGGGRGLLLASGELQAGQYMGGVSGFLLVGLCFYFLVSVL